MAVVPDRHTGHAHTGALVPAGLTHDQKTPLVTPWVVRKRTLRKLVAPGAVRLQRQTLRKRHKCALNSDGA